MSIHTGVTDLFISDRVSSLYLFLENK